MYINEYTRELNIPQYRTTNYDISLQTKLLAHKQQQYDLAFQKLQNLKSSALNVLMINKKGQEKLDAYNQRIAEKLSGDLGDLSDSKVQASLVNMFSEIANDSDLKRRSQMSKWYMDQQSMIDNMKRDKDPAKSGYNSINEFVFKNWEGGFNDFVEADQIDKFDTKRIGYTPFKDINQKLVNLTKLLHEEEKSQQMPDGSGRIISRNSKGVSPERIRSLMASTLTQDELSQFDILAKYRTLTTDDQSLYNAYSGFVKGEKTNLESEIRRAEANINIYDPSKLNPKDKDYNEKFQSYTEIYNNSIERKDRLNSSYQQALIDDLDNTQWSKLSADEKSNYVRQFTFENYVNKTSDALAWKKQIDEVKVDNAYWTAAKLQQQNEFFNWRANMETAKFNFEQEWKQAELALREREVSTKELKASGDAKQVAQAEGKTAGYLYKDPTATLEGYNKMYDMNMELGRKVTNIVGQANEKDLNSDQWISKNANNHYVGLWSMYRNSNQNPTKEGFEEWMNSREVVGDKNALGLIEELRVDQSRAEVLTNGLKNADKFIKSEGDPLDRKFGGNSLRDYSKTNEFGEIVFDLPQKDGSYKRFTLKELEKINFENKAESNSPNFSSTGFGNLNSFGSNQPALTTDKGFIEMFREYKRYKNTKIKEKVEAWDKTIGDYFQMTQYQFSNATGDENEADRSVVKKVLPNINQSLRETGLTINLEDIQSVFLPSKIGSRGAFSLTSDQIKRLAGSSNSKKVLTDLGEIEVAKLTPDHKIMFDYSTPNQLDVIMNFGFNVNGRADLPYKGKTITIKKDPAGKKNTVEISGLNTFYFDPGVDIEQVIQRAKQVVDQIK